MKNILLVRHAQTDWNIINRFQGISDIPLNAKGIKQAESIAKKLSNYRIEEIHSSTLKRAHKTAQTISRYHNIDVFTHEELMEVNFGPWEGKTKQEILDSADKDIYYHWRNSPESVVLPGDNTLKKVSERAINCVKSIIEKSDNENILFVSHGAVLKLIIMELLNLDISFYRFFWLENASLSVLNIKNDGKCTINLLNDRCHLCDEYNCL